jgi:hypothetical protein
VHADRKEHHQHSNHRAAITKLIYPATHSGRRRANATSNITGIIIYLSRVCGAVGDSSVGSVCGVCISSGVEISMPAHEVEFTGDICGSSRDEGCEEGEEEEVGNGNGGSEVRHRR